MELSGRVGISVEEFDLLIGGEGSLEFVALGIGVVYFEEAWLTDGDGVLECERLIGGELFLECMGEKRGGE